MSSTSHPAPYVAEIGARLREVRQRLGLSLTEVDAASGGRWRASTIGAYERGVRQPSVVVLRDLAGFYGVPLTELTGGADDPRPVTDTVGPLVFDLAAAATPLLERPILRLLRHIARLRGDRPDRFLTIRSSDLDTLAVTLGTDVDRLAAVLRDRGVLLPAPTAGAAE